MISMAKHSKYQDKQINVILSEMITVLEKHQAPVDLSLIVLGNMVSSLLTSSIGETQRIALAKAFSDSLMNAIKKPINYPLQ